MIVTMEGFRKFGLWLSALIVGPAAVTAIIAFAFAQTMGSAGYVKQTFAEAKVYESLGNFLATEAEKSAAGGTTTVQEALAKTATEDRLKVLVEQTVDQAYAVLDGDIMAKDFSVDITELKNEFVKNLDNDLTKELTSLPACNYANQPTSSDITEYSCLPTGADVDKLVAAAQEEALASSEFFESGEIGINNFESTESQDQTNSEQATQNPVDSFQQIADLYQLSKLVLPIAAGFAVLSAIGVVVLSKSRLKGGRRLGVLLLGNAIVLAVISFITRTLAQNFPINNAEGTLLLPATAFELAGQNIAIDFATMTTQFGLGLFMIGLAITIIMSLLIAKYEPKTKDTDLSNDKPAPAKEPPLDIKPAAKPTNNTKDKS